MLRLRADSHKEEKVKGGQHMGVSSAFPSVIFEVSLHSQSRAHLRTQDTPDNPGLSSVFRSKVKDPSWYHSSRPPVCTLSCGSPPPVPPGLAPSSNVCLSSVCGSSCWRTASASWVHMPARERSWLASSSQLWATPFSSGRSRATSSTVRNRPRPMASSLAQGIHLAALWSEAAKHFAQAKTETAA